MGRTPQTRERVTNPTPGKSQRLTGVDALPSHGDTNGPGRSGRASGRAAAHAAVNLATPRHAPVRTEPLARAQPRPAASGKAANPASAKVNVPAKARLGVGQ
jgi:hypothetical protein